MTKQQWKELLSQGIENFSSFLIGFLGVSAGKESACNAGDTGDADRSLGQEDPLEENDELLQYSCLENLMDR